MDEDWTVEKLRKDALAEKKPTEADKKFLEHSEKLRRVRQVFIEAVVTEIGLDIQATLNKNPYACYTTVPNPHKDADLEGISWSTLVRGHYMKDKKKYSKKGLMRAGIMTDLLEDILEELEPHGVKAVKDVSDFKKGNGFYLRVEF